ncbi:Enterochelin esterase [Ruminococcus sp. YRD2003]|uniref:glycoside hydrolase family 11 protein n=1 Tax=Ruminococcus sp. YRD2003 TaxID=1452313 RepID=UPI0008D46EED|nr:Enterochelin esterase [Ruminococcus flavefaciens]
MRFNGIKKLVSSVVAGMVCMSSVSLGGFMSAHADKVLQTSPSHTQETGSYNGYHHEIWQADTPNSSTMTLYDNGGGFGTSWKCGPNGSRGNFLARRGLFYGLNNPNHWQDYGGFTCDFDCSWSAGSSGNSRICIYGWTQNPLVEFYIIEDWKNWRPTSNNAKQVTIDGSVYDVFTNPMNSYTIEGNKAFTQYISVRRDTRTKGTISVSEHFKAWENLGMKMGGLYEVAFNVEGWESDGQADVKSLSIEEKAPIPGSTTTTKPVDPDTDGSYIKYDFDSSFAGFSGRGSAKVSKDSENYYDGGSSMFVSGRSENWHGAAIELPSNIFKAGETYSFSAAALQKSGASTDIKMTLQYNDGSKENYDEIALVTAKSDEWTKLENVSYTLPSGATDMTLYFEAPDDLTDFYIDNFVAAVKGTKSEVVTGNGTVEGGSIAPPAPTGQLKGDFYADKVINTFDLVAARQALLAYMAGTNKNISMEVADVDGDGAFAVNDLVVLSKFVLGQIKEFPKSSVSTTAVTTKTQNSETTTSKNNPSSGSFNMATIANDMVNSSPGNFNTKRGGVDYGKVEKVSYQSKDGGGQKSMNVILPAGYSTNKKYPVFYVLHGIGGNEDSMVQMGMQTMLGNLLADGLCEPMIIVSLNMVTGGSGGNMFSQEFMRHNDLIREDIKNSVMPYMEEHYSVATGRENTAISGFSLGGREALYTGITDSENYGYVGGACPAPGIFPTRDMYMEHEGSLKQESQFKPSAMPYLILISAAANDGVVGNYPESYHKALQNNNVEHIWNVIPSGDHGNATVDPHMYNFMRYLFKAS